MDINMLASRYRSVKYGTVIAWVVVEIVRIWHDVDGSAVE